MSGIKLFAIALGIAAIFGTLGFAETFTINANGDQPDQNVIASGDADLLGCNHNVEVNPQGTYVDGVGFVISTVEVDADPTCYGFDVTVVLTHDGDAIGTCDTAELDTGGDATVTCDAEVGPANDIHVLIDGEAGTILP